MNTADIIHTGVTMNEQFDGNSVFPRGEKMKRMRSISLATAI